MSIGSPVAVYGSVKARGAGIYNEYVRSGRCMVSGIEYQSLPGVVSDTNPFHCQGQSHARIRL